MEQNRVLSQLYNSLMQVPHRDYAPLVSAFSDALVEHPAFASRAAVYVALNSKIRDQVDCAIIALLQADPNFIEYRNAGQALLLGNAVYNTAPYDVDGLPPYRIFRINDFIQKSDNKITRRMKDIMTDYMLAVQEDSMWFDSLVLLNRSNVKSAYRHYHIPMNELSKAVLYDDNPPEDSKLAVLKVIANSDNPKEQAKLVIEHQIPYKVAQSVLGGFSPIVSIALIDVMTPTEALNSRAWVEKSGILEIPEVRDAYTAKLKKATKSVASADFRKSAQGSDVGLQSAINEAKETSVAKDARIGGQTDIWLDVSQSMNKAIEITPRFASRIWPLCDDPVLIAHNVTAWEITVKDTGNPLQDVTNALHGTRAGGGTQFAPALAKSRELGRTPQRIVMLTDGGENGYGNRPGLAEALARYESETGILPQLTMIEVRGPNYNADVLSERLNAVGYEIEKFVFNDDYYLFDQVTAFLQGETPKSLVENIMEVELPYVVGKVK